MRKLNVKLLLKGMSKSEGSEDIGLRLVLRGLAVNGIGETIRNKLQFDVTYIIWDNDRLK